MLQALVLLLQTAWGPRWFVPKRFLPAKYDYHRPVVPREVAEGVLDSSSAPPSDVETGYGGAWLLPLANACQTTQAFTCMISACLKRAVRRGSTPQKFRTDSTIQFTEAFLVLHLGHQT